MSPRRTIATALRGCLGRLRRDPRTIALLLVVPSVLLTLLKYLFDASPRQPPIARWPDARALPVHLHVPVTSIAMLRERTSGTLERPMASPIAKSDLLCG